MHDTALVVFARAPEAGRVKTRLAKALGERQALAVYRQLLACTARAAKAWAGPVLVAATGPADAFRGTGLERHLRCEQAPGSLGERLAMALRAGCKLAAGAIVIGTDCPEVHLDALHHVEHAMQCCDAAFGPASDGGFWAFGSSSPQAIDLLADANLPWSTDATLHATRALLHAHGLRTRLGPTLADVDTIDDLRQAVHRGLLTWPVDLHA